MTDMRNSFTVVELRHLRRRQRRPIAVAGHLPVLVGSSGNPYLKPFKAKALDLSYEKYFANKEGYVSAALFYKKLDTYIVPYVERTTTSRDAADAPGRGPVAAVGYIGLYTTTVNGGGGNLKGFELTAQLPFSMVTSWLTGFGINGSFADTTSSVRSPNTIGLNPTQAGRRRQHPAAGPVAHEREGDGVLRACRLQRLHRRERRARVHRQRGQQRPSAAIRRWSTSKPQRWVSAQVGYEVQDGWLKGLGVRLEGNNLNKPIYKERNYDGSHHHARTRRARRSTCECRTSCKPAASRCRTVGADSAHRTLARRRRQGFFQFATGLADGPRGVVIDE